MTQFLFFLAFVAFVFACGATVGATILRDWLDRPRRKRLPKARPLPLAIHLDRAETRRLAIPAVWRQSKPLRIIDVLAVEERA